MSEPFFRSKRKLNTIGLIIAVLAIIIFIVSCLLNVYAYATTPTATPTASITPTTTNTPRPSFTPTSTPTLTETPTLVLPTITETLSSIFTQPPFSTLEGILVENNYDCAPQNSSESDQNSIICTKMMENLSFQLSFTDRFEGNIQSEFIAAPFDPEKLDAISEEFIWLSQLTSIQLWTEPLNQTTTVEVTPTNPTPEPDELSQWIDDMIRVIFEGDLLQNSISGLEVEMGLIDAQLRLLLRQSGTGVEN
jgi:hypothetical protein